MDNMNFIQRKEAIYQQINSYKSFYIWGTGSVAEFLIRILKRNDKMPCGFIVSDGHKKENMFQGFPVYENWEMQNKKDCCVYVAVHNGQTIAEEHKDEYGYIAALDDVKDLGSLYAVEAIDYLTTQGVDVSEEYLNFSGWKVLNPFVSDWKYCWAWLGEYVDMILPAVYQKQDWVDEGPYELDEVVVCEGDVVLDCGANIGMFSSYCMKRNVNKCICFEPVPEVQEYLGKNIDGQRAVCAPYAVSDRTGKAVFQMQTDVITAGTLASGKLDESVAVDTITIDQYIETEKIAKVDFIKADIEGAERAMLQGAEQTIKKFLPKIAICTYHLPDDPEVLEKIIRGYSEKYIIRHKWKKLFAYVPKD